MPKNEGTIQLLRAYFDYCIRIEEATIPLLTDADGNRRKPNLEEVQQSADTLREMTAALSQEEFTSIMKGMMYHRSQARHFTAMVEAGAMDRLVKMLGDKMHEPEAEHEELASDA